jgi:uncharacterized protein (DUF1919 family)
MKNLSNLKKKFSNLPFQDLIWFLKRPRKILQGKIVRYNKAKQQGVAGEWTNGSSKAKK